MLEEYTKYYKTFETKSGIVFKYNHSLRVMNLCEKIGKDLHLTKEELEVVKLIGLLHDYSRFEQWDKFNSFNDLVTFDHGDRAAEILFDENEIEKYNLDKKYYEVVYDAIKNHNKYEIGNVSEESILFCKIIRDADKLDILEQFKRAVFNNSNEDNTINEEVKKEFFLHKSIHNLKERTVSDNLVMKMALIYDLNFDYSFKYIKKHKVIERMEEQIDMGMFKKYTDEIRKYVEDKIC